MMATLLLIAFEAIQGNYHATVSLIFSGLKPLTTDVISEYITASAGNDRTATSVASPLLGLQCDPGDECVREMLHISARYSATTAYLPSLKGQFLVRTSAKSIPLSNPNTLENCQDHLNYILPLVGAFAQKAMKKLVYPHLEQAPTPNAEELAKEQAGLLATLREYRAKIERLSDQCKDVPSVDASWRIAYLRIHALASDIMVSGCLDPTETFYDSIEPRFRGLLGEIEALQSTYADSETTEPRYCDHVGILPVLSFVSAKCRVYTVRRRVLEIAEAYAWREGLWDGKSVSNGTQSILQMEQQSCDAFVPAEDRWVWLDCAWDIEKRFMKLYYIKLVPTAQGERETASVKMPL